MKRTSSLFAAILVVALGQGEAKAWEPATTHAGLTEQAALGSALHSRLREHFGTGRGVYAMLTIPEADAPELFAVLRRLNPTHGYVPDTRGRMSALSWLVAGSVIADVPSALAGNHFFDPRTGKGLSAATAGGLMRRLQRGALGVGSAASLGAGGEPAASWWRSEENPMGYLGFADQFRKAVSTASPAQRERHLAGTLLAAGAMLHVLQDMGSPSHVRNDLRAHQEHIGTAETDLGSRFERLAALAFGRLGVPAPNDKPAITGLGAFFSNAEGTGLADITERSYFSNGTLPALTPVERNAGASELMRRIQSKLRRPEPSPPPRLDVVAARNKAGATWTNADGVCLTRYKWERARMRFWIDDRCALEQLEAILPTVSAYGVAFLDELFPGDLRLEASGQALRVRADSPRFGAGKVQAFSDSADGSRSEYFSAELSPGASLEIPAPGKGSVRVTVLFDGRDATGADLLATTSSPWPLSK